MRDFQFVRSPVCSSNNRTISPERVMTAGELILPIEISHVKQPLQYLQQLVCHSRHNWSSDSQSTSSLINSRRGEQPRVGLPHSDQLIARKSQQSATNQHLQSNCMHNVMASKPLSGTLEQSSMNGTEKIADWTSKRSHSRPQQILYHLDPRTERILGQLTRQFRASSPQQRSFFKPGSLRHVKSTSHIRKGLRGLEEKLSSISELLNQQTGIPEEHHLTAPSRRMQSFSLRPELDTVHNSPLGLQKVPSINNESKSRKSLLSHKDISLSQSRRRDSPLVKKTTQHHPHTHHLLSNFSFQESQAKSPLHSSHSLHEKEEEEQHMQRLPNRLTAVKLTESYNSDSNASCLDEDYEGPFLHRNPQLQLLKCNPPSETNDSDIISTMTSTHLLVNKLGQPVKIQDSSSRTVKLSDFQISTEGMGKGQLAQVYLARHKASGLVVVLKALNKSIIQNFSMSKHIINAMQLQMMLSHPNIMKVYGQFMDEPINSLGSPQQTLYVIMEYVGGCTLSTYLSSRQKLPLTETIPILRETITSIAYLHQKYIAHRGITPSNIWLASPSTGDQPTSEPMKCKVVKLCDLGGVTPLYATRENSFCTFNSVGPKVLDKQENGLSNDIRAIGTLAYELLTGTMLSQETFRTTHVEFPPISAQFPQEAKQFISVLLSSEPSLLPKCRDLLKMALFTNQKLIQRGQSSLPCISE